LRPRWTGPDLRGCGAVRPRAVRRALPAPARPRHLPAAVAVRVLVPLARAHGRGRPRDGRGGPRLLRRGGLAVARSIPQQAPTADGDLWGTIANDAAAESPLWKGALRPSEA